MKLGLQIVDYTAPGGPRQLGKTLTEVARTAEAVGFKAIGVADHVWQNPHMGGIELEHLEAYSVLSYLVARTESITLLALVTPATFRAPGLLANLVTSLDVLSDGRAMFGIGAGHTGTRHPRTRRHPRDRGAVRGRSSCNTELPTSQSTRVI